MTLGGSVPINALRILFVEDSADDVDLISFELRRIGRPVHCERADEEPSLRALLAKGSWDVVISDWSMPKLTAPRALEVVRESDPDLPLIIVSGAIGEEVAVEAMRAGARDFLRKDRLTRLCAVVDRECREQKERQARRVAERALLASEARFHRLAESGIIGIAVSDMSGNILEANEAYLKLIGGTRRELLDGTLRWTDLVPPEHSHLVELAGQRLRDDGVAPPWETETVRKDGTRVPILVGLATLDHPRCLAVTIDLTAQRHAEVARAKAEEALRNTEAQLRQAQKMEAVGRLAGGVAHDFNNLLSVILSYGDFLLEDLAADDPIRDDVEQMTIAGKRAADLTRQLLLFSRQQVLETQVLDLNTLVSDMRKMIQRVVGEDVEVVALPNAKASVVLADPGSLEQVIMNLVVNARDAMPTGGKLTIETSDVELDQDYVEAHLGAHLGPHVVLSVSDNGLGMDHEVQTRVFEPFFTTKELGKGTGLGLSTVFGIVSQTGGHVGVYSEPSQGTTFRVYLPSAGPVHGSAPDGVITETLGGNETVLLVEDEEQVRVVACTVLRRHGYQVLEARNAGEALLICESHPGDIHVLLSDVVMPQMSGPQLAKRLAPMRPNMKILYMSGYTDDAAVRHGLVERGVAFLQKPLTPTMLTRKVRQVLDSLRPPSASLTP
jgi:two-component system cell cycle sensor histidine kinase/response regulator CckA